MITLRCFYIFLICGILFPFSVWAMEEAAGPFDELPEWGQCASSSECTSIKTGCYYWQPLNKLYISNLPPSACLKSIPAGPQPGVTCVEHRCVNSPFTVQDWDRLEPFQRLQVVSSRMDVCREHVPVHASQGNITNVIAQYEAEFEKSIRKHQFPNTETLDRAVRSIVPCGELVAWEQGQEKWKAIQSKNLSGRRVVVEQVRPAYSVDLIYPPLIQYASALQKCAYTHSIHSPNGSTWWGDFRADFAIAPSGMVDPDSYKAVYPGAAYMKKFIACASKHFQSLRFQPPSKGKSVQASVLIHFPYQDPGK